MPYHQLTVDDFPVNDRVHPGVGYWIKTFVDPRFHFYLKPYNGFGHAYVSDWIVYSGFDKRESSRKSTYHELKTDLPYVQALLDINEIYARELAIIKVGDLPEGRAANYAAAQADLEQKIKALVSKSTKRATQKPMLSRKRLTMGRTRKKLENWRRRSKND